MHECYSYSQVKSSVNRVDSWWSRLVLRQPCNWVLYLIANKTRLTPNNLSTLGFLFVLGSAWAFFSGDFYWAAILFQLSLVFDFIDGRLARLTRNGSYFGELLDNFFDQVKVPILLIASYFGLLAYHPEQVNHLLVVSMLVYLFLQEFSVILWLFVEKNVENKLNAHSTFERAASHSIIGRIIVYGTTQFDKMGLRIAPSNIETNVLVFSLIPLLPYFTQEIYHFANFLLMVFIIPEIFVVFTIVRARDNNKNGRD